jgi:hypothetical protein
VSPNLSWLLNSGQLLGNGQTGGGSQFDPLSNQLMVNGSVNPDLVHVGDPNDPLAQAHLAQLQQYDPSAHYAQVPGGDGGEPPTYALLYDSSKLPAVPKAADGSVNQSYVTQQQLNADSQQQYGSGAESVINHQLLDPSLKTSSDIWGDLTPESNYSTTVTPGKTSALDILGPLAVMAAVPAFGALGGLINAGGGAAGALAGGSLGDLGASAAGSAASPGTSPLGSSLTKFVGSVPQQLANGKFNIASLLPVGESAAGLPSWLGPLINAVRSGGGNINPIGAATSLAGIFKNAGQ